MKDDKMNQLSHAHFLQKIWKNEVETIQHEVEFFLQILENRTSEADTTNTALAMYLNQFHHFQRLTKRILNEINQIESEFAEGVLSDEILNTESKKDHLYLKGEMDFFEYDYNKMKKGFKEFLVNNKTS